MKNLFLITTTFIIICLTPFSVFAEQNSPEVIIKKAIKAAGDNSPSKLSQYADLTKITKGFKHGQKLKRLLSFLKKIDANKIKFKNNITHTIKNKIFVRMVDPIFANFELEQQTVPDRLDKEYKLVDIKLKPTVELKYNIPKKINASQHIKNESDFVEWWYSDGFINNRLSYVLTFFISDTIGNCIELTIHDGEKNKSKTYLKFFSNEETTVSRKKCKIQMGENHLFEKNGTYYFKITADNILFKFTLTPQINSFGLRAKDHLKDTSYWVYVVAVPRGRSQGTLEYNGEKIQFSNQGYQDHNYFPSGSFNDFGLWYWGRFFTNHYTIILAKRPELHTSSMIVFKNTRLLKSLWNKNDNNFYENNFDKFISEKFPEQVTIGDPDISISIKNKHISKKTKHYSRFVNEVTVRTLKKNNNSYESGTGFSEFIYGK